MYVNRADWRFSFGQKIIFIFQLFQETISVNTTQPEDIRGTIHLTLNYDLNAGILTVRLIEVGLNTMVKKT